MSGDDDLLGTPGHDMICGPGSAGDGRMIAGKGRDRLPGQGGEDFLDVRGGKLGILASGGFGCTGARAVGHR